MILGMSTSTFTLVHVVISLVGIVSGLVVLYGLLAAKRLDRWTALFLVSTVATSVSGFGFPFDRLHPAHKLAIVSLIVLAIAILARYGLHLKGAWRWIYVVSASLALYFNVFALVAQSFAKVPALKAIAPSHRKLAFVVAELAVLGLFVVLTTIGVRSFRPEPMRTA
jgi:hypothetical protein